MTQKNQSGAKSWRKVLMGLGLALAAAAVAVVGWKATQLSPRKGMELRLERAPGGRFDLEEFKGRPVLVHFWASWCPPCVAEIKSYLSAGAEVARRGKGPVFVAVAVDTGWDKVEAIVPRAQWPASVVMLLDSESQASEMWGSFQFPETYALDAQHRVIKKWVGSQNWETVSQGLSKTLE